MIKCAFVTFLGIIIRYKGNKRKIGRRQSLVVKKVVNMMQITSIDGIFSDKNNLTGDIIIRIHGIE